MKKDPLHDVIPNTDPWSRLRAATKAPSALAAAAMPCRFRPCSISSTPTPARGMPCTGRLMSRRFAAELTPRDTIRVESAAADRRTYLTRRISAAS